MPADRNAKDSTNLFSAPPPASPDPAVAKARLMKLAGMFGEHKNDQLMRELLRLAIKCAQEGWIGG